MMHRRATGKGVVKAAFDELRPRTVPAALRLESGRLNCLLIGGGWFHQAPACRAGPSIPANSACTHKTGRTAVFMFEASGHMRFIRGCSVNAFFSNPAA